MTFLEQLTVASGILLSMMPVVKQLSGKKSLTIFIQGDDHLVA